MKKVTFTLDDDSVRLLERAAERLDLPKSQVVREAIGLYGEQLGRLPEDERRRILTTFDRVMPSLPERDPSGDFEDVPGLRMWRSP